MIKTLLEGKTEVSANFMLNAIYNTKMGMTGAEWKERLPTMYMWIDYISIPQPGAVIAAEATTMSDELRAELDKDGDGQITREEMLNSPEKKTVIEEQDHRKIQSTDDKIRELIEGLKGAVDSIPSYIERSSQMWILVPPVKHANLDASVCDFNSWRNRGWCRMEFAAAKLAVGEDMPLMVIKSTVDMSQDGVQYFNPCDTFKLCASKGDFSVESDRDNVNATLGKMVHAKARYYEGRGDPTLSRLVQCFTPVFVPREAIGTYGNPNAADPAMPEGSYAPAAGTAVSRMKQFFRWRSEEEEAVWMAETGLNLLTLACTLDDAAAVEELLALPKADVQAMLRGAGSKKLVVKPNSKQTRTSVTAKLRSEPFGQLVCAYAEGMSPLIAAMTFASTPVVQRLIDAGADVRKDGLGLLGMAPCHFRGAILSGRVDNVRLLLDKFPQFISMQHPENKATPLHMACWISKGQRQREIIELLLERGAKDCLTKKNMFGETPFQLLSQLYDQDPAAVQLLIEAAGDDASLLVTEPIKPLPAPFRVIIKPMMKMMALAGVPLGIGFTKILRVYAADVGTTAVHRAARRGDVAMLRIFKEAAAVHAAHPGLTDARRQTPLEYAAKACKPTLHYPAVIKDALGELEAAVAELPRQPSSVPAKKGRPDQVLPNETPVVSVVP